MRAERTTLARGAAVSLACLLAGLLAPVAHHAIAAHQLCDDHGLVVHGGDQDHAHSAGSEEDHEPPAEHEHCAPEAFAIATAALVIEAPVPSPLPQLWAITAPARLEAPRRASARYRLAPKGSPPA